MNNCQSVKTTKIECFCVKLRYKIVQLLNTNIWNNNNIL